MASEDDVRRICLGLPGVEERAYERLPGFFVKRNLFARIRTRPDGLLVWRPTVLDKEALIAERPDVFFQTPHYEGHPSVLVHLDAVEVGELEELLTLAWTLRAPAKMVSAFEGRVSS